VWARIYYYFLVSSGFAVFKTHPLLYRLNHWAPKIELMLPPARLPRALSGKPKTSSLTAPLRADRPAQGFYLYSLTTTTTPTVVDYYLIFKLRAHPPALILGLDR